MPTNDAKKINVQLVRSPIGYNKDQQKVIQSLGFNKLNSIVVKNDSPMIRGMINKVRHLVAIEGETSPSGIEFQASKSGATVGK
jgi:large subunit ribosomal protein L30